MTGQTSFLQALETSCRDEFLSEGLDEGAADSGAKDVIRLFKATVVQHRRNLAMKQRPPEHLTIKEKIVWCKDNGGHFDAGGFTYARCCRCPWGEDF